VSGGPNDWAALRALPAETILHVLGALHQGNSSYLCPRFPGCSALFHVYEHPMYGVSVRCSREGCILSDWNWPEVALSLHMDLSPAGAAGRLVHVAGGRRIAQARTVVRAFVGG
jgi:hypothetical protein